MHATIQGMASQPTPPAFEDAKAWAKTIVNADTWQSRRWRTSPQVKRGHAFQWAVACQRIIKWILADWDNPAAHTMFTILPILLLRKNSKRGGKRGAANYGARFTKFQKGNWEQLLNEALADAKHDSAWSANLEPGSARSHRQNEAVILDHAENLAKAGKYAQAIRTLEGFGVAANTAETVDKLRALHGEDKGRIPPQAFEHAREIAPSINFTALELREAINTSARRSSEDAGGWKVEHLSILTGVPEILNDLTTYFTKILRGDMTPEIRRLYSGARLVALNKDALGHAIRPIGVPLVFRRVAGRMLARRHRDSWGEHLRGNGGYVTQFAIGRPAGAQQCGIAVQELLAAEPTFEAHAIDLKNAFNEIARCVMTRGILACDKDGGREALPFFLSMHDHKTELFYHRHDGTAEIIPGQTGCTQGDSLGMQLFCLGLHTILCDAQLQGEHVRIFAIADDVTLVGPREESLKVIEKLRELCAAGNLTMKKIDRLIGRDSEEIPGPAVDPLSHFTAEHEIAYTCKPWDTGAVVGTTELIPDGMKIVGLPVGNARFVNAHVNTKADEHAERLKHIKTLGRKNPHLAAITMHYCCVTRLNYLLQCVPYSVAPMPYDRAYKDILETWQTLADVTHDELNLPFVRERVALPFAYGGQNITDFSVTGDAATIACWANIANDLATHIPGLEGLDASKTRAEDLGQTLKRAPRWGGILTAHERLQKYTTLPPLRTFTAGGVPAKKLHTQVTNAIHTKSINDMLTALAAPSGQLLSKLKDAPGTSGCADPAGVVAAEIRSLGGEGALEWHLQTPFKPSLTVDAKTYSVLVRLELSLLTGRTSTRGPATHARLCDTSTTSGGSRTILHNTVRDAIHGFANESGCVSCLEPVSILATATRPGQKKRPDIAISDFDMADTLHPDRRGGIVVDVVTAHPVTATGKPRGGHTVHGQNAARTDGYTANFAHDAKLVAYNHEITQGRHEVVPFAVETYGRLHPAALNLLDRMSRCAARRHKTRDPADFAAHNAGHIRHRWVRELSTVRARALGYWLRGHTRHHAHDVEAARLVDSTNLLARDLMSAQPGTHQTNPDPRGIAGTTANDAADE